jgi:toxin CcdB
MRMNDVSIRRRKLGNRRPTNVSLAAELFRGDATVDYFLDCQADSLRHFASRFVVPLLLAEPTLQADRLHPIFEVEGSRVVMVTHLASAVPLATLHHKIANFDEHHLTIIGALDMLLGGY